MRIPLLLGAIVAVAVPLSVSRAARTQNAPLQTVAAPGQTAPGGTDLLMNAGQFWNGPNGYPSAAQLLAPAENLRRQRLAVAGNAAMLANLRAALKLGITPPTENPREMPDFAFNARVRELARQLYQEAAVRAADGDALGAAQSSLDSFELSRQIERGSLIQWLVAGAVWDISRDSLLKNAAPSLDAAQSRAVAAQWEAIAARQASFEQMLRDEKSNNLRLALSTLQDPQARAFFEAELNTPEKPAPDADSVAYSHAQIRQILALSPARFEANNARLFDAAIARAALPYQSAKIAAPLQGQDPYTQGTAQILDSSLRFLFERNAILNRFVVAALQLRALKLESGSYPDKFDAGVDPFSPTLATLIYRREGDKYRLYSVGPDGKDDGGANIRTLETDDQTGAQKATTRVSPNSTGDILALVL